VVARVEATAVAAAAGERVAAEVARAAGARGEVKAEVARAAAARVEARAAVGMAAAARVEVTVVVGMVAVARVEAMMVVRMVAVARVEAAGTGAGDLERVAGALVSEPLAEASSVVKATVAKAEAGDAVEWMEAAMERAEVAMPVKVWVATMAPVAEEQRASANVVVVVVRQAMATGGCTPGSPGKIGRCCT
jgi:hypothetical protein